MARYIVSILSVCYIASAPYYILIKLSAYTGRPVVFVNSYALCSELSNETRFKKNISNNLNEVRNLVGDGLFTVGIFACYRARNN